MKWRPALDELRERRNANESERDAIMAEYARIVEGMFKDGYAKLAIAREAKLNRNTVYAMLEGVDNGQARL